MTQCHIENSQMTRFYIQTFKWLGAAYQSLTSIHCLTAVLIWAATTAFGLGTRRSSVLHTRAGT
jgi:hypothetical protein